MYNASDQFFKYCFDNTLLLKILSPIYTMLKNTAKSTQISIDNIQLEYVTNTDNTAFGRLEHENNSLIYVSTMLKKIK